MNLFSQPTFDEAEATAHIGLQAEYGSLWTHMPMVRKPNASPRPDPNKPPYDLSAVFSWEARDIKLGMEDAGVSSRDPKLTVHVGALRFPVLAGDQFQQKSTGLFFEVTNPQKDGLSGIEIDIVQLGRPA